jgi:penicillin G amidase
MKFLKYLFAGIFTLLIIGAAGAYFYLRTLKPDLSGELRLEGLTAPVEVYFDNFGVPHIYASSEDDAYVAFGYLHAQDRLFQMEMLRRAAGGRLAEVLGPDLLVVDKLFRTLGLNKFSRIQSEKFLNADTTGYQRAVHAYLKGINEFVRTGETPLEFSIIGIPKTEFLPEDVYAVVGFMALGFAEGFEVDPVFQQIKDELGDSYLVDLAVKTPANAEVIPVYKGDAIAVDTKFLSGIREAFAALPVPLFQGSNGWVVSADKSASGFPILANDTHIGFSQPAVWYEAHIEYPGFSFYGHHLAGLPFGILGNNRFCGWGLTMFENDDVDFFIEKINPDNSNQVKFRDDWEDMKVRNEIIKIKGEQDFILEVKETRHGPVINGIIDHVDQKVPVSLSWLLLLQDNQAIEAAYLLGRAANFQEAEKAVAMFSSPGLNVMYGDVDGNIAWWASARLPVRPAHVESKLFLDGASGQDEYLGLYDFSKNPKSVNPPWGFVYSANNQPDSVDGVLYPGYYYPRSRAGRIAELLKEDKKFSTEDMQRINLDETSHMHADVAHEIARIAAKQDVAGNSEIAPLVQQLAAWTGDHAAGHAAPAIYYNVISQILNLTLEDELGSEALGTLLKTAVLKNSLQKLLSNEASPWWDNINTKDKSETRDEIVIKAFENAYVVLQETLGKDARTWEWATVHTLTHGHALGKVKPLNKIFDVGPFPVGGGSEVLNNLDFRYNTSGYFPVVSGPALRKITDFSNVEQGVTVSPTGQSGNVMSPHYSDQAEMFVNGKFRPMLMNRDEIIKQAKNKLILNP